MGAAGFPSPSVCFLLSLVYLSSPSLYVGQGAGPFSQHAAIHPAPLWSIIYSPHQYLSPGCSHHRCQIVMSTSVVTWLGFLIFLYQDIPSPVFVCFCKFLLFCPDSASRPAALLCSTASPPRLDLEGLFGSTSACSTSSHRWSCSPPPCALQLSVPKYLFH